jgi:hypothetical protein
MAEPGYRDDIVTSGPLSTDDYFILTNSLSFFNSGIGSAGYSHTLFTLGLVTGTLTAPTDMNLYQNPQILFSAPLTAKVIDKTAYGAISPLYVRYQNFELSYLTLDGIKVPQVKIVLQAFDKDKKSVGYIQQNFAYLSSDPVTITLQPEGVTFNDQLSAGLPFSFKDPRLGYGYCDNIGEGYCSYLSDANYGSVYEGSFQGTPVNRVIALPLNYYQNTECSTLIETPLGSLPQSLAYQECLSLNTSTTYSLSSACQNLPHTYTNADTCLANPNGAYVASSAGTSDAAVCGTAGQYLQYYSGINSSDLTETTTTFGPCSSGQLCLYDNDTELFVCVNDERSPRLVLFIVLGIILVLLILCVIIAVFIFSGHKKHKVTSSDANLDPNHLEAYAPTKN